MFSRSQWLTDTELMWKNVKRYSAENCKVRMSVCKLYNDLVIHTEFPGKNYGGELHRISGKEAIVLGIDVKEWTRREWTVQAIISANIYELISRVSRILKGCGILSEPDPIHIAHTGDGAMIVFVDYNDTEHYENTKCLWENDCKKNGCLLDADWEPRSCKFEKDAHKNQRTISKNTILKALSFMFAVNAMVQQDNLSEKFDVQQKDTDGFQYLPLYLRFALSMGRVFPVVNALNDLECVGSPMVTASRILATDHGNHFLVDRKLLHEMNKFGGIQNIGNETEQFRWNQNLMISELAEKKIKNETFRYADVVGFHEDGPLIKALNRTNIQPVKYQIGSHDVRAID